MSDERGDVSVGVPQNLFTAQAPARARVVSNRRVTGEACEEVRHLVLDVSGLSFPFREGQSVGVVIPGLPDRGHASQLRFYSIASSRHGEDEQGGTLSLCVKRVRKVDPETGQVIPSATNFLCDVTAGDTLDLAGPFGKAFLLPDDPSSNLILVATGTGLAPFRGFLQHVFRDRRDWTGQVRLFAGARTCGDLLFREELEALRDQPNFRAYVALSQEQTTGDGHRLHVHHRMAEAVDEVWQLLDSDRTYLYLCGLKGMEEPVERVLEERARRDGISWRAFHRVLQDTGRLLVETY